MIKKIKSVHKLATTANLLAMALIMSAEWCKNDDPGAGKGDKLELDLSADLATGADKATSIVAIPVNITVKQGELDPTKWTISLIKAGGMKDGASGSAAVVTCPDDGKTIKQLNIAFPDKLTKADGTKKFTILLKSGAVFGPAATGPANTDIQVGFASIALKGKHKTKDGKEEDQEFGLQLGFTVAP